MRVSLPRSPSKFPCDARLPTRITSSLRPPTKSPSPSARKGHAHSDRSPDPPQSAVRSFSPISSAAEAAEAVVSVFPVFAPDQSSSRLPFVELMNGSCIPADLPRSPSSCQMLLLVSVLHMTVNRDRFHRFIDDKIEDNLVVLGRLNFLHTTTPFALALIKNGPTQFRRAKLQFASRLTDRTQCIASPWTNLLYPNSNRLERYKYFADI